METFLQRLETCNGWKVETLDLSHNHLSGQVPQNFSSLTSLSHLNLSYNLSRKIPSGNQLRTFTDPSIYVGNPSLCGVPVSTVCPGASALAPTNSDDDDHNEDDTDENRKFDIYVSVVLGFIIG
ncbi:putative non-specific serine/threonine protein kinase [Rosa chinensis]|uniref:Putative non-specific serine/threonine protein kinase n=1 Tax=Rosa chinensis TaxID=74649 RepID=A0A2P6Q7R1_ROSCH|nr:putative non-specific serine/threonine protein kinase [Rosa chinensis]